MLLIARQNPELRDNTRIAQSCCGASASGGPATAGMPAGNARAALLMARGEQVRRMPTRCVFRQRIEESYGWRTGAVIRARRI